MKKLLILGMLPFVCQGQALVSSKVTFCQMAYEKLSKSDTTWTIYGTDSMYSVHSMNIYARFCDDGRLEVTDSLRAIKALFNQLVEKRKEAEDLHEDLRKIYNLIENNRREYHKMVKKLTK